MRVNAPVELGSSPRAVGVGERLLAGRYVIRRRLGEGGMGVVYEAFDDATQSAVALKTLTRVDAAGIYRLKNEFRSLADTSHPNLIPLYDLHADGSSWFFTMGLVDGPTFLEHVREDASVAFDPTISANSEPHAETVRAPVIAGGRRSGTFRERTLREALAQLAAGVSAIHAAGKLHRDLKPSNVLVTSSGRVVILDFGLVSDQRGGAIGRTLAEEGVSGTPAYMAPEQARGQRATAASDWYAVGVMLFEALTGELPFDGSVLEVLGRKQNVDAPPPAERAPGVPADLNRLCIALLRRDPKDRPSGDAVLAQLGTSISHGLIATSSPTRSAPSHARPGQAEETTAPFVGREAELAELEACLRVTDERKPMIVLVSGPSGIGKTALIERFLDGARARDPDTVVLSGRCYEREAVPYKAFDGVVDALTRYLRRLSDVEATRLLPRNVHALCRLFPVLERVEVVAAVRNRAPLPADPLELRRLGFAALKELFLRITDGRRLVVMVDDLQWGDADSFHLLDEVLGPPDPPGLLFVGACRSDEEERGPLLSALLDTKRGLQTVPVRTVAVEPLSASEVALLAKQLSAGESRIDAGRIHAESHGNPFFAIELVRYTHSASDERSTVGLGDVLRARLAALPAPAKRLLEVISVAAQPIERTVAAAASELDAASVREQFEFLRASSLARSLAAYDAEGARRSRITTYHDRVRDAVTRSLSDDERRHLHLRLAEALEADGHADAEMLSHHFLEARDFRRAGAYAFSAAERAGENLAFERAAMLYRIAVDHGELERDERLRFLIRVGDALAWAGRAADAARAYLDAAQAAEGRELATQRRECRRRAAETLLLAGEIEQGMQALATALAELKIEFPPSPRAALIGLLWDRMVLAIRGLHWKARAENEVPEAELARLEAYWHAAGSLGLVQPVYAAHCRTRYLLFALRSGVPRHVALSLSMHANSFVFGGARGSQRAQSLLQQALAVTETLEPDLRRQYVALVIGVQGCTSYLLGRFADARKELSKSMRESEGLPLTTSDEYFARTTFRLFHLWACGFSGDLWALQQGREEFLRDAVRRGDRYFEGTATRSLSAAWLARDQPDEALRSLEALSWAPLQAEFGLQEYYELRTRGETALYVNEAIDLSQRYQGEYRAFDASIMRRLELNRNVLTYLRARFWLHNVEHGFDPPRALREAKRWSRRLLRADPSYAQGYGALIAAGVEWQRAQRDASVARLREAIEHFGAASMTGHIAAARWRLGQIVGGDEGAVLLSEAYAWAEREHVKNPDRFLRMYAPGFDRRPGSTPLLAAKH